MVFKLPESSAAEFEFQLPGDKKKYVLPLVQDLPLDIRQVMTRAIVIAERIRKASDKGRSYKVDDHDLQVMQEAEVAVLNRYCPGIVERISEKQFKALMEAWNESSQVDLGE